MIIIGGTYSEICFEPIWENIFGSGFRAASLILENDTSQNVAFHTCCDDEVRQHLAYYEKLYPKLALTTISIDKSPIFYYDHPLKTPIISPRPDHYSGLNAKINAKGEDILIYGLLEASIECEGKRVVYDPQSPVNPVPFSVTGSKAEQLVTVVNYSEAVAITQKKDTSKIVEYFYNEEGCHALIIKMGAKGAMLFESGELTPKMIPVFKTEKVWPIGSGDIFSAYFAYNWFKGNGLEDSAILASKATAIFCNSKDLRLPEFHEYFTFPRLIIENAPQGQIYLAGPFFTFSERWLVNEIWNTFKGFNLRVFSPFHDVGHGKAKDVVDKDLIGLDASEVIFAVIDGLDSGTLFEVGYAIAKKKKVIAFVQNEGEEALKMLEGTDCVIENDLTTAIYKTYWTLASK